jgi:8-oxo-dGTP pyrophosphatase MutT (NUDIX family)
MDETQNPWKVLSRNSVYENQWIRVDHHEVLGPSGKPGIYATVHFKNLAVGVVPLDIEGRVVLVGQYRFPLHAYSWEIPEGGGSHENTPLESAQRELREECGLAAGKWLELIEMDLSNSVSDERSTAFLAWELSETPAEPDEHEQLQIRRVPFWDAVELVKRGAIRDSITISALLRMALMAKQGELPPAVQKFVSR